MTECGLPRGFDAGGQTLTQAAHGFPPLTVNLDQLLRYADNRWGLSKAESTQASMTSQMDTAAVATASRLHPKPSDLIYAYGTAGFRTT